MNWVLVRKDPALRLLGPLLIATATIGLAFRLLAFFASEREGMMMDTLTHTQVMVLGSCLFFSALLTLDPQVSLRTRVLEFQQPLPVAAHELVQSRLPGLLALGWLPLWICTIIVWPNHSKAASQLASFTISSSLTWSAWVGMSFACQPNRRKGPHSLLFAGLTIIALAMAIEGFGRPLVVAPIAGTITLLTFSLLALRRVPRFAEPRTLQIPPHLRSAFENRWQPSAMLPPLQHWLRKTTLRIPNITQLLITGVFSGAVFSAMSEMALIILLVAVHSSFVSALPLLERMGHLPIPRRVMARWVFLPPPVLLLAGMAIGARARQFQDARSLSEALAKGQHLIRNNPVDQHLAPLLLTVLLSWAVAGTWATRTDVPFRGGHLLDKWRRRGRQYLPQLSWVLILLAWMGWGVYWGPKGAPLSHALAAALERATESSPWIVSFASLLAFGILFRFLSRRFERMEPPLTLESVWVDKLP